MPQVSDSGRIEPSTDTREYVTYTDSMAGYFESEPRARVEVDFGALSETGPVRDQNEDHFLVVRRRRERDVLATSLPVELLPRPEQAAYVVAVADGMGGHAFGELASYLALRTGWEMGGDEVKWPLKSNENEAAEIKRKATILFRMIDKTLHAAAEERPRLTGMGTTLTLCYSIGPELFVFHAGDSRAYLLRRGGIDRLTTDHTLGQALVDAGLARPDSPEAKKRAHVLTNVLGGPAEGITVDVARRRLLDGDRILLCTDGLSDVVPDAEIAATLDRHEASQDACKALVALALARGSKDNVTVVVGRYAISPEPDEVDRLLQG